jgi:hypothetical protein
MTDGADEAGETTPDEYVLSLPQRLRTYAAFYKTIQVNMTREVALLLASDLEVAIKLRTEKAKDSS